MEAKKNNLENNLLKFNVTQVGGTEEMPILELSRDEVTLTYELDIINNRYRESPITSHAYDIDPKRVDLLKSIAVTTIQNELKRRREAYSDYFA